jgi:DNA-binding beta-propeller fold protein YncE
MLNGALALGTLAGLSVAAAPASAGGPPPVGLNREWGTFGIGPGQFANPTGVATDGYHIYVADTGNGRVQEFAYGGKFLQTLGSTVPGYFNYPTDVALDSAGDVYVTQDGAFTVDEFTASGAFVRAWGGPGSAPGQFQFPCGVAVDGAGDVYVADSGNNRIQKFTGAGAFLQSWGTLGTGPGQFNTPCGVAVDNAGNVYVTDDQNNRVQKFTSGGAFLLAWGTKGSGPGYFNDPQAIAVDRFGNVFVADTHNHRVQQFDSNGTFLQTWGTLGTGKGQMLDPAGVAVYSSPPFSTVRGTTIYVTQAGSNRVQEFWEGTTNAVFCAVCQ